MRTRGRMCMWHVHVACTWRIDGVAGLPRRACLPLPHTPCRSPLCCRCSRRLPPSFAALPLAHRSGEPPVSLTDEIDRLAFLYLSPPLLLAVLGYSGYSLYTGYYKSWYSAVPPHIAHQPHTVHQYLPMN